MSEQKPIVSIYVETSIKLDNGDFFVVNKITEKDGRKTYPSLGRFSCEECGRRLFCIRQNL